MFVRTLAFPLSVLFFGIGLLMIVVQREHRSLHDLIAKSCVVYDWGDRSAEMPGPLSDFLNRAQPVTRLTRAGVSDATIAQAASACRSYSSAARLSRSIRAPAVKAAAGSRGGRVCWTRSWR